jgi:hypothetical protein
MVIAGFRPSSALLHLLGLGAGLPVGIVMLRRGWVDCEGWDWFSRRARRPPQVGSAGRKVAGDGRYFPEYSENVPRRRM